LVECNAFLILLYCIESIYVGFICPVILKVLLSVLPIIFRCDILVLTASNISSA
uniref:Uncharacterized protein n=1 Tax=Aegilops tauschii subsp. strangulata TaxID=200361 RepID=A0A453QPP2_AEGTS